MKPSSEVEGDDDDRDGIMTTGGRGDRTTAGCQNLLFPDRIGDRKSRRRGEAVDHTQGEGADSGCSAAEAIIGAVRHQPM